MRIRREEAGRALEILEDYHGRLFAPEDSETRSSIEQIIRIFKSELFQALLDIQDVYEASVKNGTQQNLEHHSHLPQSASQTLASEEAVKNSSQKNTGGEVSASDVQQLFSPGKLNEILDAVLQHDKKRQLQPVEEQLKHHSLNNLQVKNQHLSASSSPLPLESIGEAASESESSSSNFETVHDYYPNGQTDRLNGLPEIVSRSNASFSPVQSVNQSYNENKAYNAHTTITTQSINGSEHDFVYKSSKTDYNKNTEQIITNVITPSNLNGSVTQLNGGCVSVNRSQSRQSAVSLDPVEFLQSVQTTTPPSRPSTNMSMNPGWEYEEVIIDRGSSGLGFSIAGGIDNPHVPDDTSIYITKVIPGGAASNDGRLQTDDIILKVNDVSLVDVLHSVAVEALKLAGNRVHLFVKRRKPNLPPSASAPANMGGEILHVELFKTASKGLGFSIGGGIGNQHVQGDNAIYITKVMEKGAAALDGRIEVGDKLIAVNDVQLDNVTHEEAVAALKASSDQVMLTIRKPPIRSGKTFSYNTAGLLPLIGQSVGNNKQLNSFASGIRQSTTLTRTSLQSLPVSSISAAFDERSQTLPMPRHANNLQTQQSNNVYNHSQNRLAKSNESIDMTDNLDVPRDVRRVVLTKSASGLGFNIVGGEDGEGIFISFILAGGAADQSEQIFRGDQVLEVNGVNLRDSTHHEAAQTLKNCGNTVSLLLVYKPEEFKRFEAKIQDLREQQSQMQSLTGVNVGTLRTSQKKTLYVRALFDYEPSRDSGLPSRGLMFRFGDILHVTNASDDEWWQARRVLADGKDDSQIGIIPSKRRVERRERARVKSVKFHGSNDYSDGTGKFPSSGTLDKKKKNFSFSRKFPFMKSRESSNEDIFTSGSYDQLDSHDNNTQPDRSSISGSNTALEDIREDGLHLHSYEVVCTTQINYVRPVVILGPLKERINDDLLSDYPERFGSCVPHTTRPRRPDEVDGREYYYVSTREKMEELIQEGFFIEAGQYRDNLYGTSLNEVRDFCLVKRKHCILDVSAAALQRLKIADFNPIAILIRPKSVEQLREWDKRMPEEEARKQFEQALKIESTCSERFTAILCCDTPEEIYAKVKLVINDNYGPTIWIPSKNQKI